MRNIFAAQEKIAGRLRRNFPCALGGSSRAAKAIDPEAQRLVLEGRYHWNLRTFESFGRAEEAFRKAIALAPEFAEAHAGLAGVCVTRANFAVQEGQSSASRRYRHDATGTRRLPCTSSPRFGRGARCSCGWRTCLSGSLSWPRKAMEAHWRQTPSRRWLECGMVFCWLARDVSLPLTSKTAKARELDPLWFMQFQIWGNLRQHVGDYGRAAELLTRASELRSDIYVPNYGSRVSAEFRLGHKDEAVRLARQVRANLDIRPRGAADAQSIYVLAQCGFTAEANEYARVMLDRLPLQSHVRGFVLAAIGRTDEAWPYLARMSTLEMLRLLTEPMFEPVRRDPRFSALAATLRIPQELLSSR
jgi:tetratricopeptide (TPR) repeat protein